MGQIWRIGPRSTTHHHLLGVHSFGRQLEAAVVRDLAGLSRTDNLTRDESEHCNLNL